jgi:CRP-like cAMP-binding protein
MPDVALIIANKLKEHSELSDAAIERLRRLPCDIRNLGPQDDIVRQGERARVSAVVLSGMVGRYHAFSAGRRQYISLHIPGDWPEAQSLFIETMDHAVCAIDTAEVALIPHAAMIKMLDESHELTAALWRETLIDAAIFREAITNNSARDPQTRLAHLFCEIYYRMRAGRHAEPGECPFPLSQSQVGEALGFSIVTANRMVRLLRQSKAVDWYGGRLYVDNWKRLAELGEFDPAYLHLKKPRRL